jgi:hypothetical protein
MEDEKTKPSCTNVFTGCKEEVGQLSKASVNKVEAIIGPAMREVGITSKVHARCTSPMERSEFVQYVYCVSSRGVLPAACRLPYMPMFYRPRRVECVPRQACRRNLSHGDADKLSALRMMAAVFSDIVLTGVESVVTKQSKTNKLHMSGQEEAWNKHIGVPLRRAGVMGMTTVRFVAAAPRPATGAESSSDQRPRVELRPKLRVDYAAILHAKRAREEAAER